MHRQRQIPFPAFKLHKIRREGEDGLDVEPSNAGTIDELRWLARQDARTILERMMFWPLVQPNTRIMHCRNRKEYDLADRVLRRAGFSFHLNAEDRRMGLSKPPTGDPVLAMIIGQLQQDYQIILIDRAYALTKKANGKRLVLEDEAAVYIRPK